MNIVGTILRSMFGTLAQEDAEAYLKRFKEMEQLGEERRIDSDQQTTLQILSNMNEANIELQNQIAEQFVIVNTTITTLGNDFENIWINLEFQFQMENLYTFISLSLTAFHNKQKQFLEAIAFGSKASTTNPIILPPAILIDELKFIKQTIAVEKLDLPLPIIKENLAYYYQIASTRSRIINDQLLVSMSIPLPGTVQYELMKLTSFPHILPNKLYNFIVPTHEYVAIDDFSLMLI